MPRIRTLKPGNWHDEAVCSVSKLARLLRDVLLTYSDDDGRWRHQPRAIIGFGYPEDDDVTPAKVTAWAAELHAAEVLHLYEHDGRSYGCFPSWHRHQVINKYTPSLLPAPVEVSCASRSAKGGSAA